MYKVDTIHELQFFVHKNKINAGRKIARVDIDLFEQWYANNIQPSYMSAHIKDRFIFGIKEFNDKKVEHLDSLLSQLGRGEGNTPSRADISGKNKSKTLFVTQSCIDLLGLTRAETFEYMAPLYTNILINFHNLQKKAFLVSKDDEVEFCSWIPYRLIASNADVLFLEDSRDADRSIIVYISPKDEAIKCYFNAVAKIYDSKLPIIPVQAYPLEIPIEEANKLLMCSHYELQKLIDTQKISCHNSQYLEWKSNDITKIMWSQCSIYLHEIIMFIRDEYGDGDERLDHIRDFLYHMADICVGEQGQNCEENGDDNSSFYENTQKNISLAIKLTQAENELTANNSLISTKKNKITFMCCLKILFSKLDDFIRNNPGGYLTKSQFHQEALKMAKEEHLKQNIKLKNSKYINISLANAIYDYFPEKYRAKKGNKMQKSSEDTSENSNRGKEDDNR